MNFGTDKQLGRVNVNFLSDSKKTKKTHVQHKHVSFTGKDKLFQLQKVLFKDGLEPEKYEDYIQEKMENGKYYYKGLTNDDVDELVKVYKKRYQTKNNKVNLMLSERKSKKRQLKLFKEKKRVLVEEQKRGVIDATLKELSRSKAIGVGKSSYLHTTDPDKWNNTKKLLFIGGRYFESMDKDWVSLYQKLVSGNSAHLFDLHSQSALNERIMNH
jgi:hypothetical protein